ncbi:hypothetical protein N7468_005196 [Penicillium chermesinum]|uniref:Uncharacterized protein n=1 Tax=Penicillium chermesinum TaxID=63820 RepID=A0A9W9TMS4_9EURO|nr:uncharacterized protein N7468_005196 [Penicillium chermesinum]KAJ5232240.1 hypothetical protein N7468_005196 [Penicillium chermesinum]
MVSALAPFQFSGVLFLQKKGFLLVRTPDLKPGPKGKEVRERALKWLRKKAEYDLGSTKAGRAHWGGGKQTTHMAPGEPI